MKGKMKILFTVQRPLHCKGKRKERGEKKKKDEENAIVFFFVFFVSDHAVQSHAIEIHRLSHDNQ